jgi:hypothetical protein
VTSPSDRFGYTAAQLRGEAQEQVQLPAWVWKAGSEGARQSVVAKALRQKAQAYFRKIRYDTVDAKYVADGDMELVDQVFPAVDWGFTFSVSVR